MYTVMNNKNIRKNILIFFNKGKIIQCKECKKICNWGNRKVNDSINLGNNIICHKCVRHIFNCKIT
jgi:heterodisulfide reductase subunit A-like polyferredoxin